MYCPNKTYKAVRSVSKSDGTTDVIVDFKQEIMGNIYCTTYNVTIYKGNEYKINSIKGLYGDFPHGEKFPIR